MKHTEGTFTGINDTEIYYQHWIPDTPKGIVLISHGYGEHSGRYQNVVDQFTPESYGVWALDHRGQGKSKGRKSYVNKFTDYLQDLAIFEDLARKAHPDLPFHLLGHSMGSIIANHYMASFADQSKFKSLLLSGTGSAPGPEINKITILMSKIFSVILPKISIPAGLDPSFISHDEEVVKAYINDPLVQNKITPRLGNELMKYVSTMNDAASKVTVPTSIQMGSEDTAFHPDSWNGLFKSFPNEDKQYKIYDGYRHEVFNELKKEIPLSDALKWINKFN